MHVRVYSEWNGEASNLVSARSTKLNQRALVRPGSPPVHILYRSSLPFVLLFPVVLARGRVTPDNISVYNDKKQTREITRGITEPNNMSLVSRETGVCFDRAAWQHPTEGVPTHFPYNTPRFRFYFLTRRYYHRGAKNGLIITSLKGLQLVQLAQLYWSNFFLG